MVVDVVDLLFVVVGVDPTCEKPAAISVVAAGVGPTPTCGENVANS